MKWQKRSHINDIGDIVSERTGMDKATLIKDTKEYHINNLDKAIELFWFHIQRNHPVRVYTDYDADGINSANIFNLLFALLNYPAVVTVPCRFSDGYGIKPASVSNMKSGLLITVDNGIAANEAVSLAKENGLDVLILDHHKERIDEVGNPFIPIADVIVDPHVTGGDFTDYCGAGLAFKFCEELLYGKHRIDHQLQMQLVKSTLQKMNVFAAIGTVADSVSLTGENRRIVKNGLLLYRYQKATTGLLLLAEKFYLKERITAMDIGFKIGPAINAYGRLEDKGSRKVCCITSYDGPPDENAQATVDVMFQKNQDRKEKTTAGILRAEEIIHQTAQENAPFIVIYDPKCEEGIAGIIAGRITEKYNVPSIVLTDYKEPSCIKGSGRSIPSVNLKEHLDEHASLIHTYGGHPMACGLTVKRTDFNAFVTAMHDDFKKENSENEDTLYYDLEVPEEELEGIMDTLDTYGPYGQDNPEIIVRVDNIQNIPSRYGFVKTMGKENEHLKYSTKYADIIIFDGTREYEEKGKPTMISVCGTLDWNIYKETKRLQISVIDYKYHEKEKPETLSQKLKNII